MKKKHEMNPGNLCVEMVCSPPLQIKQKINQHSTRFQKCHSLILQSKNISSTNRCFYDFIGENLLETPMLQQEPCLHQICFTFEQIFVIQESLKLYKCSQVVLSPDYSFPWLNTNVLFDNTKFWKCVMNIFFY